jgi:hypothetical protein
MANAESTEEPARVETVEEFKLRIASIINGKPQEIPAPRRTNPLLVRPKKRPKRRVSR